MTTSFTCSTGLGDKPVPLLLPRMFWLLFVWLHRELCAADDGEWDWSTARSRPSTFTGSRGRPDAFFLESKSMAKQRSDWVCGVWTWYLKFNTVSEVRLTLSSWLCLLLHLSEHMKPIWLKSLSGQPCIMFSEYEGLSCKCTLHISSFNGISRTLTHVHSCSCLLHRETVKKVGLIARRAVIPDWVCFLWINLLQTVLQIFLRG